MLNLGFKLVKNYFSHFSQFLARNGSFFLASREKSKTREMCTSTWDTLKCTIFEKFGVYFLAGKFKCGWHEKKLTWSGGGWGCCSILMASGGIMRLGWEGESAGDLFKLVDMYMNWHRVLVELVWDCNMILFSKN